MFKSNNLRSRAAILPFLITLLAVFTVGIENQSSATAGTEDMLIITGSVWYRERMMVPPDAVISISLEDVSRMGVSAKVIATTGFTAQGGPPWDFSLEYDPRKLNDKGRYGLRVRIEADGRLMFINMEHIPAFEHDSSTPIKIMVSRVGGSQIGDLW
ncbi:MAG: YbaY family lipoprotein [Deltaproteobacteria bacterium]|nr:YbaY family lipoprotein [Deltaproteobacteria bacterium]